MIRSTHEPPEANPRGPSGADGASVLVGVLALQGDVREHVRALEECGSTVRLVRRPDDLFGLDGLVLPGGESTAIANLAGSFGLLAPLQQAVASGLPCFGTCAGMVLLADEVEDGAAGQVTFGGLDVTVRRNGFGRQVDSFEQDVPVLGLDAPVRAVFIRAPWVTRAGPGVEVLARVGADSARPVEEGGRIVAVRQGVLMATSFHPEVGGDLRLHRSFLDLVRAS